jgi:UDP-N-acetylglucosamine--N-acetylmuramyl-(pentapeptide) pyrophosphoryl-undecaprenol N-acetylglucosamine transferase
MTSVVLAGGGTAGHTSPLIATAQALCAASVDVRITCIGTAKGMEGELLPAAGLELRLVSAVPLPRKPTIDLVKVPFRLNHAVGEAAQILRDVAADVVVGFGGYVSLPAYLAARRLHIPVVIQEQNAVPGLANKVAARFAAATCTSFPDTGLPGAEFLGMPVRAQIASLAATGRASRRAEAAELFGLDPAVPTLLVSGGSQGAQRINEALVAAKPELLGAGVQILHVLGPKNFTPDMAVEYSDAGGSYHPVAYVADMELAYALADLMVARSGAGTVVETAVLGLPTILVPLAIGNGEQAKNGQPLVDAGAAVMIANDLLDAASLVAAVLPLIHEPERLARMGNAARRLMQPGAAERVAAVVLQVAGQAAPSQGGSSTPDDRPTPDGQPESSDEPETGRAVCGEGDTGESA